MSLKSLWRSMKYAAGPEKTYREQRLRLVEAINHCCGELNAYVVIERRQKATILQKFLTEDDIEDRIDCSIEAVKFLDFRCFTFGTTFHSGSGSLIERLVSYKMDAGLPYEEASKAVSKYTQRLADQLSEGVTIDQFRAQPIVYTISPFKVYEQLRSNFLSLEARQGQEPLDEFERFMLEQEFMHNFDPERQMLPSLRKYLEPRMGNEGLEELWRTSGSPDARRKIQEAANRLNEEAYADYVMRRSGVGDLQEEKQRVEDEKWLEAKRFEEELHSERRKSQRNESMQQRED